MADYRFKAGVIPTLAVALLLPALIALGVWQLNRAQQKMELQSAFESRGRLQEIAVGTVKLDANEHHFRRARARGIFEPDHQVLLDNRVHRGRAGYHVLTPLRVEGAQTRILINRGWIPWGDDRQVLPNFDTPAGTLRVSGRLRRPLEGYFSLEDESDLSRPGRVWQNLDLARYEKITGMSVEPLVLELDGGAAQEGGFVREWREYTDEWTARHRGYAVQWFSLAAALVVIYVVVNLRRGENPKGNLRV